MGMADVAGAVSKMECMRFSLSIAAEARQDRHSSVIRPDAAGFFCFYNG